MKMEDAVTQREITEVLHFTTYHGITGILAKKSLLSRKRVGKEEYLEHVYSPTCAYRPDEDWLDYVNLSISRINKTFYNIASTRWHREKELWWCIASFRSEILSHEGVYFVTTNNMYEGARRNTGVKGLESLFADRIHCRDDWYVKRQASMGDCDPTDRQAEVLYPGMLSTDTLQTIYIATGEHADEIAGRLEVMKHPNVRVVIEPGKFI